MQAEHAFTRSSGATAVLAMALEPPAQASCTENSFRLSKYVAVHGSFRVNVGELLLVLLCITHCRALPCPTDSCTSTCSAWQMRWSCKQLRCRGACTRSMQ